MANAEIRTREGEKKQRLPVSLAGVLACKSTGGEEKAFRDISRVSGEPVTQYMSKENELAEKELR